MPVSALHLLVLNGPNLNLLGSRRPDIYGTSTLRDLEQMCRNHARVRSCETSFFQSNHEGELIDAIHGALSYAAGVVINPGAYAHTSIALRDAIEAVCLPTVEVHLSDIRAREPFRHVSLIEDVAFEFICGMGPAGYLKALDLLADHLRAVDQ